MSLEIKNLSVRQGTFHLKVPGLTVAKGEIVAVLGKSGSGKSTLFNAIAGFIPVEGGSVLVDGQEVSHLPSEKRKIAFAFQRAALFPSMTVRENVEFPMKIQGVEKKMRQAKALEWLKKAQIPELENRRTHEISEGQAQRVALVRALATGFPVFLLDEPFSALDTETRHALRELILRLVQETGVAALIATHHPEDAAFLSKRVVQL